jgi:serine/threonine-protein kinase
MKLTARWLCFGLMWAVGPAAARAQAPDADPKALALQARAVLRQYCHRCHHGPGSEGGDFDMLTVETLTVPRDGEKPHVIPGRPADSYLFQRMALRKNGQGDMPPKAVPERPADADKAVVKKWIESGAPAFPATEGRSYVGTREVLTAVRDHLRAADREDRPYLRYFTLTHLHNNPKVPDGDLRVYRAALSKAVNSLSMKPGIVLPQALDKTGEAVFVVDVRKLDWDRNDLWREVMRAYPYGLRYATHSDADLQKLDDDIALMTACELPLVRADWFVATATRPPLYHALLQLPKHAGELERQLGVDVAANFLRNELARAGFAQSGVSGQNRLVERHDARFQAYWKSYDFKADNTRSALPQLPLGPAFPGNPFPNQVFTHDGGELIWHLPNGLQGYLLIDGRGNRIDEGPIAVVGDALKTSGTNAIVTGVSCMACHKHGMIPFKDQVRDGTAVQGEARRKVQRLYPEAKAMDEKVREDADRFLKALERATGPFLKVGADKAKDIRDFVEPVGEIARLYRLVDLDLAMTAYELDVASPADLKALIAGSKRLRDLGLGVLLTAGGALKRSEWERVGATSLFQRVAREIEKGSPFIVTK